MPRARLAKLGLVSTTVIFFIACSSAPTHLYTLMTGPEDGTWSNPNISTFQIDVLPVTIPAQVDQPELMVHETQQRIAILENERWAAPLAGELRAALATDVSGALGVRDVHGLAHSAAIPIYEIQVNIHSFESWIGSNASIDANWSIIDKGQVVITCSSKVSERVATGYDALVQGHQRAVAHIASDIVMVLREITSGEPQRCLY